MTQHLTSEELVAALDRALTGQRAGHLADCESCREALAELDAVISAAGPAGNVPEPSPLFWDHLSARVHAATERVPVSAASPWWRPLTVIGAVAAIVIVLFVVRQPPAPDTGANAVSGAAVDVSEEAAWQAMAEAASSLSSDDVRVAVALAPQAPLVISDLTPKEREAFVELLGREMGGLQ